MSWKVNATLLKVRKKARKARVCLRDRSEGEAREGGDGGGRERGRGGGQRTAIFRVSVLCITSCDYSMYVQNKIPYVA